MCISLCPVVVVVALTTGVVFVTSVVVTEKDCDDETLSEIVENTGINVSDVAGLTTKDHTDTLMMTSAD